jgi:SAM-dependent methyltransferase
MDLYSIETKQISNLVQDWSNRPEQELEATFGIGGQVDSTTFLQIAQRLRIKGFEVIPQDDRLSIITPNHIRLSLQGLGVLQSYCKDDKLQGKPFTAMIKDRTSNDSTIDLKEYNVRIKSRREINLSREDPRVIELLDNWGSLNKAFRLIKRWTFRGKGVRIDMSMVRSTEKDVKGQYKWVKSFLENNIFKEPVHYEVEVELLRDDDTSTTQNALKCLISGIGEILRAIQKNTLLIRKSIADSIRSEYMSLVKSDRFRGVSPITLEVKNIITDIQEGIPNIRSGYNVTDKADGLRTLGFCNKDGELYLIDMAMNIYRTGLKNEKCANTLLDGEWVTMNRYEKAINHFLIFDIYYGLKGENVSVLPFVDITNIETGNGRYNKIKAWYNSWKDGDQIVAKGVSDTNKLLISLKQFQFASPNNSTIFTACTRVLDSTRIYETDGLIITSNTASLPQRAGDTFYEQFKWKPSSQNTVDFLVNFEREPGIPTMEKITTGIHPKSGQTVRYKTLRVFVGSDKDPAFDDPRNTILLEQNIPREKKGSGKYKPVLFNPLEFADTMASVCNLIVKVDPESGEEYVTCYDISDLETDISASVTTDSNDRQQLINKGIQDHKYLVGTGEPIRDRSIVEMRYEPKNESGWRWIPIRVRHDKTERLIKGTLARTLNSEKVANSVWNSIHDPVTYSMIRTGSEQPTEDEIKDLLKSRDTDVTKKYYERKASEEDIMLVRGMLDFHNKYIKNDILYKRLLKGGGKSVLDVACGKGGDLYKWIMNRARIVVGVDTAGENITNNRDGAYKRYLESIIEFGFGRVPQIAFVIGNSSRRLINGDAGATPEESNMLRSIFGKYNPDGIVPKYIENTMAGSLRPGVDVAVCMFAIHYFFENKETLDGLIQNIADTVKVGGYFAGCAFDGMKVFNLLKNVDMDHSKSGKEGDVPIWTITKKYDKEELTANDDSLGLAIDVEFISIGTTHREYLVPFELLQKRLKSVGFELVDKEDLTRMGLNNSTNTFDVSWDMAEKIGRKYIMPDSVKEFSFLNRWFIFKRVGDIQVPNITDTTSPIDANIEDENTSIAPNKNGNISEAIQKITLDGLEDDEETKNDITEEAIANTTETETGARLPGPDKKFAEGELFRFGSDARQADLLKIRDPNAARWLSLSAPFPIPDPDDTTVIYPSIEHYMAGMKFKLASNKPELAKSLMSTTGSIHQGFLNKRRLEGGIKPESPRDFILLGEESSEIKKKTMKTYLNQYRVVFNDSKWIPIKDKLLFDAIKYRWDKDERFHKIVEAAREQGKYLLYSVKSTIGAGELGGVRDISTGRIIGENIVGKNIMIIAGFKF